MGKARNETEVYSRTMGHNMRISYDISNRTEYVGYSFPGALSSEARWSIFKLTYEGASSRVSTRVYADRTDNFVKVWDDRTGYDYTK